MEIIKADILSDLDPNKPTVILHGCNCLHRMGKGIALYLKSHYPIIHSIDKNTPYGDRNKLGTISIAGIHGNLHIVNCYTQFDYRRSSSKTPHADYKAIENCLENIAYLYNGWEIRSPKIGCGLAGGSWDIVSKLFEKVLHDQNVRIYQI